MMDCQDSGGMFDYTQCHCEYPQWEEMKLTTMQKYNLMLRERRVMQEGTPVSIEVDLDRARDVEAQQDAVKREAEDLFGRIGEGLGRVIAEHSEAMDTLARHAEDADKASAQYLLDTLADGVRINGQTVRERLGDENIPTIVTLKKANYDVNRVLQEAAEMSVQEPNGVVIEFLVDVDVQ